MNANPHINEALHLKDMTRDLNAIREVVALSAHQATDDHTSYRAYLLQARSLLQVLGRINSLWTDTFAALLRQEKTAPRVEHVEATYCTALANFLEDHIEKTWMQFGGRAGEKHVHATKPALEAEIDTLYSTRHHASLAAYSDIYVTSLRERAAELTKDPALGSSMQIGMR